MAHLNFLEQFEAGGNATPFTPPVQDLPGYDAGYEAGLADAALQNRQISAALVDRLTEMRFGYAEAQQALMQALTPFVSALANQVLPALSDDLTRAHIKDALFAAAKADIASPIVLTFHPDSATLVRDAIADVAHVEIQLTEDAALGLHEVYVGHAGSETQLDVATLISGFQLALSNISTPMVGGATNG